jgi:penicillin amidase
MNLTRLAMQLLLGRRLPITSGSIAADGLAHEIVIRRDQWGVPQIEASTETDAWFGLGFCQGQDRAFQLESLLRVVRGTLSEVVGPEGLPIDRLSRRIGFIRASERQVELTRPDLHATLDAFARGVTAGMSAGARRRPPELALLRVKPTPWTAADVLGFVKLTSFALATNWDVELARLAILSLDGLEALSALDPAYLEGQPVISPPGELAGSAPEAGWSHLAEDLRAFLAVSGVGGGSNSWALAATRTVTGRPIFANDPHLAPALPPHWYLARIRTPEWSIAGASFVGAPTIPVGHNGFAAWGVTVGMTDNSDLFVEEVGPDGISVRQGNEYVPCEARTERIRVKGSHDVFEEVLVTPRGPIIGPALDSELPGPARALSIRATWLDTLPIYGLLEVHHTRSFEHFRRNLGDWPALPLNMAYADTTGSIGWQLMGTAPRRKKGNGTLPLAGWDVDAGWEPDNVQDGDLPFALNPECGFVATANHKALRDGEEPFLTHDWLEGYRAARIVEQLAGRSDWDLAATMELQRDQQCLPWREMRGIVLAVPAAGESAREAQELLRAWDGRVADDSPAAAVFELFVAGMSVRLARAKAPKSYRWALGEGFHPLVTSNAFGSRRVGQLVKLLRERPDGWLPCSWDDELASALGAGVDRLRQEIGPDRDGWGWGHVRTLTLIHPFGLRKPFDRVFNLGPLPCGGDSNTVPQAGVSPHAPLRNPSFIASLRMVVDVGAWDNSRWILPGGQSGNPFSLHYADQLPLWERGKGIPIPWSEEEVEKATRRVLRLVPK